MSKNLIKSLNKNKKYEIKRKHPSWQNALRGVGVFDEKIYFPNSQIAFAYTLHANSKLSIEINSSV